jgi:hypothetical protein|tara:strand:+ start:2022 stop:2207 length:186 start_codon:yes stop_codon:yes gene_type:complete
MNIRLNKEMIMNNYTYANYEDITEAINIVVGDDGSKAAQIIEVLQQLKTMRPENEDCNTEG